MTSTPTQTATPTQAASTRLFVSPAPLTIASGLYFVLQIRVENAVGLYGVDLSVTYDPSLLEIVDADDARPGIQAIPGDFPRPESVAANAADNSTGSVRYTASLVQPSQPLNGGGLVATLLFRSRGAGSSVVHLVSSSLLKPDSSTIPHQRSDGTVTASTGIALGTVVGTLDLQARANDSGTIVTAGNYAGITDSAGSFALLAEPGSYQVQASHSGYLTARRNATIAVGGETGTPPLRLRAGNLRTGTQIPEIVDVYDLTALASVYGQPASSYPEADFNQDGVINIFDLVALASSYQSTEDDYAW